MSKIHKIRARENTNGLSGDWGKKESSVFSSESNNFKRNNYLKYSFYWKSLQIKKVIYPLEHNSKNFLFGILKFIHSTSYISLTIVHEIIHTFLLFFFFRAAAWHIEVPRLVVKLKLQLTAYTTAMGTLDPSLSVTYTTAHSNVASLTHWMGPRIKPASSWILAGFITAEPQWELPSLSS